MLKKTIIRSIFGLGKCTSYLVPYKLAGHLDRVKLYCHSGWISREFKRFDKGAIVYRDARIIGGKHISIGQNTVISERATLTAWEHYNQQKHCPCITIGNNVRIGECCHITAIGKISIGNDVLIGKNVTITDNAHGSASHALSNIPPADRLLVTKGEVILEDRVWIGDKATILPKVRIGTNTVVGANSVVTKDLPANCIAVGAPARVI